MKKIVNKILSFILCIAILFTMIPASALAAELNAEKLELDDGYMKVTVSGKNGGFLIDTVKGDKLDKADDNKNLLYPAADYDTSYTSFRVTRKNGTTEEYIFGRKYGFLGLATRDVVLTQEGNAIVATWGVKDLTVQQKLTLLDETASLHGMVNISYTVSTTKDDIQDVKMRVMYDTALGFQDYATYEVPNRLNEYTHVIKDTVIDNSGENEGDNYSGTLFAVDNVYAPTITAYTVDATMDGETVSPYQMAFGHWNNLASSVFDFVPNDVTFTNAYNQEYMTADSAYAMYYDLGEIGQNEEKSFSTYYGIYSNATQREEETVAINFPVLPAPMEIKEGNSMVYMSQVENGSDGDIHLKMMLENISDEDYEKVTVVVETMNNIYPYEDYLYYPDVKGEEGESLINEIDDFKAGEEVIIDTYFNVEPLIVSEYRCFKVLCYNTTNGDELTGSRLISSREFYLFCPGELGETIVFNTIDPTVIYYEGTRNIYLSGLNLGLLKDTTAYTAVLHSVNGGTDAVVPGTNVIVDTNNGTINLVVDETMATGTYQVIFDWVDPAREDATSELLRFQVTDNLSKVSATYGVVTVEKADDFTEDNPTYALGLYTTEEAYQTAIKNKNWDQRPYLEFRGNFGVRRENGEIVEVRANSLTDIYGDPLSTINISNCLDVECGTVALRVENPGEDDQVINIDIDGKVYTTNARTSVWDGVCAITSFADGDMSTMLQYDYEGNVVGDIENSVANTNGITLLWPGAASTMQTIAGMFFEFRYCQFGYMALEKGTVNADTDRMRVISFGAELSPDFLIPSNFDWGGRKTSAMDVAQMTLAKKNYTSDQLRELQDRFAQDQQAFLDAERGSLSLYVTDILFGGGFAGFNTTIEVGLPEYGEIIPSLEGTLNLKVLPATMYRDGRIWEFGVAGTTDLLMLHMEGSFGMKETPAGVPVIDNFYCFVDGGVPGINLDGVGVFWLTGVGGGVSNIYDSMFVVSKVPPMALTMSAGFRLFQIMSARANVEASLRGLSVSMTDISIAGITLIDKIGFSAYWYPELKLRADMYLDILDIIKAGGYIVIEENQETNEIFWEGFASGSVQTPSIGIIPGIKVGSVDLGVNASKVWGALHVLKLDMGVTYYWGGDVDFAFGKYDAPESTYPLAVMAVGQDSDTGRVLYMSMGANAVMAASSDQMKARTFRARRTVAGPGIESAADCMTHTIDMGTYDSNKGMLLNITYTADSQNEAELIAKGNGMLRKGIEITADGVTDKYPLTWLDTTKAADDPANAEANAMFACKEIVDEETGKSKYQATVSISFTEEEAYENKWVLTSEVETVLGLYELAKMPGLDSVDYTYTKDGDKSVITITELSGNQLDAIGEVSVYAVDEHDRMYPLGTIPATNVVEGTVEEVPITVPADLSGGTYSISVVANNESENICATVDATHYFNHVNPLQPADPVISSVQLGGDYSIDVTLQDGDCFGYRTTIYEKQNNQWVALEGFTDILVEAEENGEMSDSLVLGGSSTGLCYVDSEGSPMSMEAIQKNDNAIMQEKVYALEAGKTYRVGLVAYNKDSDGRFIYSDEIMSSELTMVAPDPAQITVQAVGAKTINAVIDPQATARGISTIDVVTTDEISFRIASDKKVSGSWFLDGSAQKGTWSATNDGTITLNEEVSEGEHMLTLRGENENGDASVVQYRFRVDRSGPAVLLSSPVNGAFFGGSDDNYAQETVHVIGRSEPGTTIVVELEGGEETKAVVDASGNFDIPIVLDETQMEQTVNMYGVDAAGNTSDAKKIDLTNAITGAQGVYLGIFLNDEEVTNQTIPAGSIGDLEVRFVKGEQSVVIPEDSKIGQQMEWSLDVLEGNASLEEKHLFTDPASHGMLYVEYGMMNSVTAFDSHTVTFSDGEGYRIQTDDALTVSDGGEITFTLEFASGYTCTEEFTVTVDGEVITPVAGVYTISNIRSDKSVKVVGVEDITAPDATITVGNNIWKSFLNIITFNLLFKDTQTVTITATDEGSEMKSLHYYVSNNALTLEAVEAVTDWTEYTDSFTLVPNANYVIYAKAEDNAGNVRYVSSDGLSLEKATSSDSSSNTPSNDRDEPSDNPPLGDKEEPSNNIGNPSGDKNKPSDNTGNSSVDKDKPADNTSIPSDDKDESWDNTSTPSDDTSTPSDEEDEAQDNTSIPVDSVATDEHEFDALLFGSLCIGILVTVGLWVKSRRKENEE